MTETDWRAEKFAGDSNWQILKDIPGGAIFIVAQCADEETALQMVADHGKAALCEELADALEGLLTETVEALEWVSNEFRPGKSPPTPLDEQPSIVQARAALKAAGRAPQ